MRPLHRCLSWETCNLRIRIFIIILLDQFGVVILVCYNGFLLFSRMVLTQRSIIVRILRAINGLTYSRAHIGSHWVNYLSVLWLGRRAWRNIVVFVWIHLLVIGPAWNARWYSGRLLVECPVTLHQRVNSNRGLLYFFMWRHLRVSFAHIDSGHSALWYFHQLLVALIGCIS